MKHPEACKCMGVCTVFFSSISMNYMLALSIELVFKLRNKVLVHYKLQRVFYHVICIGFALFLVVLAEIRGDYGSSGVETCSLVHNSLTENIRLGSFGVEVIIFWIVLTYMAKKIGNSYSNLLFNYYLVILSMTITVTLVNVIGNVQFLGVKYQHIYGDIALIIGTTTGIWVGLSRLANRRLLKQVLWKLGYKPKNSINVRRSALIEQSDSMLSENIYNFGDLFEDLSKKTIMQLLTVISLRFEKNKYDSFSLESEPEYDEYEFDVKMFEKLGDRIDIANLNQSNMYEVYDPELYLVEYKPKEFHNIREISKITSEDLLV